MFVNLEYIRNGDYLFLDLAIMDSQDSYGKYGILLRTFLNKHKRSW